MRKQIALTIPALLIMLAGCDVDVEDKGKLPEVDVKEGRMPDVDVRGPDVDVKTDTVEVPVPDVDIDLPKEEDPAPARN